jgi:hypothetical protein
LFHWIKNTDFGRKQKAEKEEKEEEKKQENAYAWLVIASD